MKVCGKDILIQGRVIRIARLAAETYEFLSDPGETLDALKACGRRIDLFTFTQQLPDITPRYAHPMELDNLAAVPISTFEHWWKHQINGKTRNMIRRAESKGITVREVPFDDALVHGIKAIYDESPVRQGRSFWHYMKDVESARSMYYDEDMDRAAKGFGEIWQAVMADFLARHRLAGIRVSINDAGATPAIVALRLDQAIEEFTRKR